MATAIGVISGILTIFSFIDGQLPQQEVSKAKYTFYLGNDGTRDPNDPNRQLSNAGGEKPDVRSFDPLGRSLGITVNDGNRCRDGSITCETAINDVDRAPEYTLFSANNDAICISWVGTTYPNDYKYSVLFGNWAQTCSNYYGVDQATWFYSSVKVQTEDRGTVEVNCGWIDGDGDQPTTGFQVHWPEFDADTAPRNDPSYYCTNGVALQWYTNPDPNTIVFYTRRRNMFARDPELETSAAPANHKPRSEAAPTKKRSLIERLSDSVVKSYFGSQSASYICTAKGAVGPSFVSYAEKKFCHMPTKTVYDFCENVALGLCWDDSVNMVVPKLASSLIAPFMNFTKVDIWKD